MTKPPTELKAEGKRLWKWLSDSFTMEGVEPMAAELCQLADRLAAIRAELDTAPKLDTRLVTLEMKISAAYTRIWKALGLAADDAAKGKPGYPAGVPRKRRTA